MILSVKYEDGYYVLQSEVTTDEGPLFEEFETDDLDEVVDYVTDLLGELDVGSEDEPD